MQVETPFSEAVVKKYPEPVVIVLARDSSGKVNPITLGWSMFTSYVPPMMAISVGLPRHSLGVIRAAGEFVIAYPSELQREQALFCGTHSGRYMDKLAGSGLRTVPASRVDCLLLDDAVANFECRLAGELITGDHAIFSGEVLASHVNPDAVGRLYLTGKGYRMSGVAARG